MNTHPDELAQWAAADSIRDLAAHIHAAEARLATLIADFTEDGHWNATGDWRSVAHWLTVNWGYTPTQARALQHVADKTAVMPTVMAHALAGEISLHVTAQIARVATTDYRTAKQPAKPDTPEASEPAADGSADGDTDEAFWRNTPTNKTSASPPTPNHPTTPPPTERGGSAGVRCRRRESPGRAR